MMPDLGSLGKSAHGASNLNGEEFFSSLAASDCLRSWINHNQIFNFVQQNRTFQNLSSGVYEIHDP
jgi:hypothetical protein